LHSIDSMPSAAHASSLPPSGEPTEEGTPSSAKVSAIRSEDYIGQVGPGEVKMERHGSYMVSGTLFHEEIENVPILKGAPVILQGHTEPHNMKSPIIRVYARIKDASIDQVSTIAKKPTTTAYVDARFEILREAMPTSDGGLLRQWTPKPMGGYRIRWPTSDDLELLGYPKKGIPMGQFTAGASKLQFILPVEALYRSLFAVGGMGGGKTNFLSAIARAIANADVDVFPNRRRPAIVILDAEGRREYADLGEVVSADLRVAVEDSGISPNRVRDFHYFALGKGERTILLDDLTPADTSIFPATLPAKTERSWTDGAERYWAYCRQNKAPVVSREFRATMAEVSRRLGLNAAMRTAILRAAQDYCWDVFDTPDTPPLRATDMLVPGRVSVVDVSRMDGLDRQRAAGLAILTLFDIAKRSTPQNPCPILLIIDEATRLVPASYSGMSAKEYSEKMGNWLSNVLHRGRRAQYGVLLATQYPTDVLKGLADQPQTKIAFALPPKYDRWVRSEFGEEAALRLRDAAQTGFAYVSRMARVEGDPPGVPHPPTAVQFPRVR
jgi:DNA helicase HerA-like ATPase